MDTTDKVLSLILFVLAAFTGGLIGYQMGQHGTRKEALLKNHAYYQADSDGAAMFTWR